MYYRGTLDIFLDLLFLISLGSGIAARPAGKSELQKYGIPKSMSLSWRLGRAVHRARSRGTLNCVHEDLIKEFGGPQSARKVFEGKIIGIEQALVGGRSHGTLVIERLKDYENENPAEATQDLPERVRIPFLNENLVLEAIYASGEKKVSLFSFLASCMHSFFYDHSVV